MLHCVLITGAARRVGAATARRLHAEGVDVILHYRNSAQDASQLCAELNAIRKESALVLHGKLSDQVVCERLIKEALQWRQDLDGLVNNAAVFYPTPLETLAEKDWDDIMATNARAPLLLTQAFAQYAKKAAAIVNLTDIYATFPLQQHTIYSMSKAALNMLTRSLAVELAPRIRVNAIAPGAIAWPEGEVDENYKQEILAKVALQRTGCEQDIADAVLYLLHADYVTGQILAVDGGRSLYI